MSLTSLFYFTYPPRKINLFLLLVYSPDHCYLNRFISTRLIVFVCIIVYTIRSNSSYILTVVLSLRFTLLLWGIKSDIISCKKLLIVTVILCYLFPYLINLQKTRLRWFKRTRQDNGICLAYTCHPLFVMFILLCNDTTFRWNDFALIFCFVY